MKNPIVDRREERKDLPGMHALIVGVSAYPYLAQGPEDASPPETLNLRPLVSAALTGYRIYRWLEEHQDNLTVPLASCRLLLSPSTTEIAREPTLENLTDAATWDNVYEAAIAWRADAASRPDNVTMFYFAGHGMQRRHGDHVLLAQDFGKPPPGKIFRYAFEAGNLINGMAVTERWYRIARTQLYFFDACRLVPEELLELESAEASTIFDVGQARLTDDRTTPIFTTTIPGAPAYGIPGEQSVFSVALLQCLNGAAAQPPDEARGQRRWSVRTSSLIPTMNSELDKITDNKQQMVVSGVSSEVVLRWWDRPPEVEVTVTLDPETAATAARVDVLTAEGELAGRLPVPIQPHPYATRLTLGQYTLRARFEPPVAPFPADKTVIRQAEWPRSPWTMKFSAPA